MDAVAIPLPRLYLRQIAVPTQRGRLRQIDSRFTALFVEQAQFDPLRRFGKDRKVRTHTIERRPKGIGLPRPYNHAHSDFNTSSLPLSSYKSCAQIRSDSTQ